MSDYPLIFTFETPVFGKDMAWIAMLRIRGRAVMRPYLEDGWWLTSVEPAGVSGGSRKGAEAARLDFKKHMILFLREFAAEFEEFAPFKSKLARLVHTKDEEEEEAWLAAVKAVRNSRKLAKSPEVAALSILNADSFVPDVWAVRVDKTRPKPGQIPEDPGDEFLVGTPHAA